MPQGPTQSSSPSPACPSVVVFAVCGDLVHDGTIPSLLVFFFFTRSSPFQSPGLAAAFLVVAPCGKGGATTLFASTFTATDDHQCHHGERHARVGLAPTVHPFLFYFFHLFFVFFLRWVVQWGVAFAHTRTPFTQYPTAL